MTNIWTNEVSILVGDGRKRTCRNRADYTDDEGILYQPGPDKVPAHHRSECETPTKWDGLFITKIETSLNRS